MKRLRPILIIVALALFSAAFLFRNQISQVFSGLSQVREAADMIVSELTKDILAPPPLRGPTRAPESFLTVSGTILETNAARAASGLPPLKANTQLASAAEAKARDILAKQYFEHVSPDGTDVGDLVTSAGYEYVVVGENLALGNFKNDRELVDAWMASPGHRANILNTRYAELGVAVIQGVFEGSRTWVAVQEFGLPASACPQIDASLKAVIDANNQQLDLWVTELDTRRAELAAMRPKRGEEYNQKAEEYNALVASYNALLAETKIYIAQYNEQAQQVNDCRAAE